MPGFWEIAAGLGVPGLALGVLYMLFRNLRFPMAKVPRLWAGWLALAWMVLGCLVVLFALDRFGPRPEAYRLQVTVLESGGQPVHEAQVWSSVGGEAKKTSGGWEIVIPAADRPSDGHITVYASRESAFLHGQAMVVLESDFVLGVEVVLAEDTSGMIRGRVVDEEGQPVEGAAVSIGGHGDEETLTTAQGSFRLATHTAAGRQVRLQVRKEGYEAEAIWHPASRLPAEIVLRKDKQ